MVKVIKLLSDKKFMGSEVFNFKIWPNYRVAIFAIFFIKLTRWILRWTLIRENTSKITLLSQKETIKSKGNVKFSSTLSLFIGDLTSKEITTVDDRRVKEKKWIFLAGSNLSSSKPEWRDDDDYTKNMKLSRSFVYAIC